MNISSVVPHFWIMSARNSLLILSFRLVMVTSTAGGSPTKNWSILNLERGQEVLEFNLFG